uniref:Brix domain-containing protein n=1 Tax=Timema bartmani TaxID=61472 RepID=A0A7R9EXG1_9NEOP|nr:unnamed protein product [Timema bartmani]
MSDNKVLTGINDDGNLTVSEPVTFNHIKNKQVRRTAVQKHLKLKRKLKKDERKKKKMSGAPKQVPRTLESTREKDETMLDQLDESQVEELQYDLTVDPFSKYFDKTYEPKVLITYSDNPLRRNHKEISTHRPEVVLNNFQTQLGNTVSRMLASLFHYDPEFKGRRAVTFHNQRDYIFFRHHRYEFTPNGKVRLRELGPRFTLKLRSLQKGTFDSKTGEYEWLITGKRHRMETSRRKFFL